VAVVAALVALFYRQLKRMESQINSLSEQTKQINSRLAQVEQRSQTAAQQANQAAQSARAAAAQRDQAEEARAQAVTQAQHAAQQASAAKQQAEEYRRQREEELTHLQQALGQIAETRRTAMGLVMTLGSESVRFDFDRSDIKPQYRETLSRIAGVLSTVKGYSIYVSKAGSMPPAVASEAAQISGDKGTSQHLWSFRRCPKVAYRYSQHIQSLCPCTRAIT